MDRFKLIVPDPDSQFRLRLCRCGCNRVGYLQIYPELWIVQCTLCGRTTKEHRCRHDAQIEWNT